MWESNYHALMRYIIAACAEYSRRYGKEHSILAKLHELPLPVAHGCGFRPVPLMCLSHCVNLARKGVAVEEMRSEAQLISNKLFGHDISLEDFPTGYYWPAEPVGKKAREDSKKWLDFAKSHTA
jgi:hypothetical protein